MIRYYCLKISFIILITLSLITCAEDKNKKAPTSEYLLEEVKSDESGIKFTNEIIETPKRNIFIYDYFYNGAGVAIGDINNDGLSDIFFCGNDSNNKLYLNQGNLKFKDISKSAFTQQSNKWAHGVNMVDVNQDGWLDIYICYGGPSENPELSKNELLINERNLKFTNKAAEYGLDDNANSLQASFFDFDKDQDLDVIITNNSNFKNSQQWFDKLRAMDPQQKANVSVKLLENNNGKFEDISKRSGVQKPNFGLGIITQDLNDDGWIDIYIANDYILPDYYLINQKNGTFKDLSKEYIPQSSFFSMGVDAADINNDCILDISTVDMTPSDHVRNKVLMESMDVEQFKFLKYSMGFNDQYMFNTMHYGVGNGYYAEIGKQLGVSQSGWSWSSLIFDMDNDGNKDYYISNGYYKDTKNNDFQTKAKVLIDSFGSITHPEAFAQADKYLDRTPLSNKIYNNVNGAEFKDVSKKWTNMAASFSNGAAYGDLDNDGDLDVVINNLGHEATLLKNNSTKNYLRVKVNNTKNNGAELNAQMVIHYGDDKQRNDHFHTRGYFSQMEPIVHFGIDETANIDSLEIVWAKGKRSILKNIKANQTIEIDYGDITKDNVSQDKVSTLFSDASNQIEDRFKHEENDFDDFASEILLPHKYSTMGPCIAVGDIDGDGFEDFYIGGAKNQSGKIYTQNYGQFTGSNTDFSHHSRFEDLGAKFIDLDGDKDLDLYVSSGGGGDVSLQDGECQDRIYLNDGNGSFSYSKRALPKMASSTKSIQPIDFDNDGDLDLFIGGRNLPGKYPLSAESYLLENSGGKFKKIEDSNFYDNLPGMISSAEVVDIDGDNDNDLLVIGEWSSPKLFVNNNGAFTLKPLGGLDSLRGWWQSIKASDLDNDGDLDFIIGNMGENNKFHPSLEKPLGVLASDFDDSGTLDIVLTKHYKDMIVPVRGKECSSEQMPFIKDKFPSYEGFATSSIDQILGQDNINEAEQMSVNTFSSYVVMNNGNFTFNIQKLPFEAQWFPIKDMVIDDFDGDKIKDVLLAGSIHNTEPETPSYDSGRGLFLKGLGDGEFESHYDISTTGVQLGHDVKSLAPIRVGGRQKGVLVGNNDHFVELLVKND